MQRHHVVNPETGTAAVSATVVVTSQDRQTDTRPRLAVNRSVKVRQRYNSVRGLEHPQPGKTLLLPASEPLQRRHELGYPSLF